MSALMQSFRCFTIDLMDDDAAITEYDRLHEPDVIWPEVLADLRSRGFQQLSIWRTGNRLFMIADSTGAGPGTTQSMPPDDRLRQWDQLTKTLQRALPGTDTTPQWTEMRCIFDLNDHDEQLLS